MKILLLGGYGNTGRILAPLLLEYTDCDLVIAGRHLERAENFCSSLNQPSRVSCRVVDASDPTSLKRTFEQEVEIQLVIVCSSTSKYVSIIAHSCLEAGIDYMDVQYSMSKTKYLQAMSSECEERGICVITDCGFHPGLPSALIRHVANNYYDSLEAAHVGSVIRMDWKNVQEFSPETVEEFAGEFVDIETTYFKDRQWQEATWKDFVTMKQMDFGPPFGKQPCIPMMMAEMKAMPELYPTLTETGFYVSGFHWVVDWFLTPFVMLVVKISPSQKRAMGRLMNWGLRTFCTAPFGVQLKVETRGRNNGLMVEKSMSLRHEDGYAMTAIPVAATVLQYLSSIRKAGVYLQGTVVETSQFLQDIKRMGIIVEESDPVRKKS